MNRVQLWSCGGGRQSAGIAALIDQGRLPKPDHICMAALKGEKRTTWDYVCGIIRPAMRKLGIPFTIVSSVKYATKGLFGGADGCSPLMPVWTNQSGQRSKLPEYCSGEWKREVVMRWAAEQSGWKERGVDCWIGISWDERQRRRAPRKQWYKTAYPILDWMPKALTVAGLLQAVEANGWPTPPRSRCVECPNQGDAEWAELSPEELERACVIDERIRAVDPNAFLHRQLIPLRQVVFQPESEGGNLFSGGCSSGMCY